jgi:hypothetical protein
VGNPEGGGREPRAVGGRAEGGGLLRRVHGRGGREPGGRGAAPRRPRGDRRHPVDRGARGAARPSPPHDELGGHALRVGIGPGPQGLEPRRLLHLRRRSRAARP